MNLEKETMAFQCIAHDGINLSLTCCILFSNHIQQLDGCLYNFDSGWQACWGGIKGKGESVCTVGMMNGTAAPFIKVCPQVFPTMVVIIERVYCENTACFTGLI